jgi:acyl carrier protein
MIPTTFTFLRSLPRTNGKLDRAALPAPDHGRPDLEQPYAPPQGDIEALLAQIWEDVLNLRPVGIHDNFFDLGGHSLAASRVVSRVLKHFRLQIPLQSLFQMPTIAQMAELITEHEGNRLADAELEGILDELESLSDDQAQRILATSVSQQGSGYKPA